jgi:hypothetical protein
MKTIVILGDSHTRSFAYRKNVLPIFVEGGASVNLANTDFFYSRLKLIKANNALPKDAVIIFYLGEPDVRFQLGYGWIPNKKLPDGSIEVVPARTDTDYLDKMADNYAELVKKSQKLLDKPIYVLSPTSSYPSCIEPMSYLNSEIPKRLPDGANFIEIFSEAIENGKIKEEYKSNNWNFDPLHLNWKVCDLTLERLVSTGVIDDVKLYGKLNESFEQKHIKSKFKMNKRFGSYIFEE